MNEPLRFIYDIACPAGHAFRVWTERIDAWWPRDHTITGDRCAAVVLEPRVGGRIFERTPDGREIEWGEILEWDAPRRVSYLWHLGRHRDDATDVAIDFVPLDDDTTRVEITHAGWERLGADGAGWRDANTDGWSSLLPHFTEACATVR